MMTSPSRTVRTVLAVALAALPLAACTDDGSTPAETTFLASDEPLSNDQVTAPLLRAPDVPAGLGEAAFVRLELRHPELFERVIVEVIEVSGGTSADLLSILIPGALIRVPADATIELDATVEVVLLDGDTVSSVEPTCEATCSVQGPALIAPEGWFTEAYAVQAGWLLVSLDA